MLNRTRVHLPVGYVKPTGMAQPARMLVESSLVAAGHVVRVPFQESPHFDGRLGIGAAMAGFQVHPEVPDPMFGIGPLGKVFEWVWWLKFRIACQRPLERLRMVGTGPPSG